MPFLPVNPEVDFRFFQVPMPRIRQLKTQFLTLQPRLDEQPILRGLRQHLAARLPALPRLKRAPEKPPAAPGCLRLLRIFERKHLQPFDFFRTFSRTNQRFDAAFRTFFVRKPQFSTLFCQKPAFYLTVFSLANRLFFPAVQGFCPFL